MSDDSNCKDCIKVENVENIARGNTYSIQENTKVIRKVAEKVNKIDKNVGIDNSRIDSLFDTLEDIKEGIKELTKALKELQIKPLEKYDKITITVVASVLSALIGSVITTAILKL